MKISKLTIFVLIFALITGCTPSESAIQTAIAETAAANPTSTYTATITETSTPSATLTFTSTVTRTITPTKTISSHTQIILRIKKYTLIAEYLMLWVIMISNVMLQELMKLFM